MGKEGWREMAGGKPSLIMLSRSAFDPRGCGLKWEPLAAVNGRLSTSGCDFSKDMFFGQDFQDARISYTACLPCICRMD